VLHSQSGDMNLEQLKAYWAALRRALTGFTITREQIIVEGRMAAARSTFSGTFDKEFIPAGGAAIKPTGKPVRFEVIGTFQFNEAGQLVEEWVQSDQVSFLKQFGVELPNPKK
jgi:predicted ester cyclase